MAYSSINSLIIMVAYQKLLLTGLLAESDPVDILGIHLG